MLLAQYAKSPLRKFDMQPLDIEIEAAFLASLQQLPVTLRELKLSAIQESKRPANAQATMPSPSCGMQATRLRQVPP
jgi:hypothetical protein